MSKKTSSLTKKDKKNIVICSVIVLALLVATVLLFPVFKELANTESRDRLISFIRSKGVWGVLILMGLQLLQVVVALIPGEIVEVVSGIIYGTFGGYIICTVGVLLSSMLVFYTVRKLGAPFVQRIISSEKMGTLSFLHNTEKVEMLIFLLFFIPGTPKDMLTYFVPLTNVKPLHFFILTTVARIPSIISSTYAGANIEKGKFGVTVLIFAITGILGIIGIIVNNKLMKRMNG